MKRRVASVLLVCMGIVACAHAQGAAAAAPEAELMALERFLSLNDTELEAMAQAIQRVRAMSPAERAAFLERIAAFRGLPQERRNEIRAMWGWVSEEDRNDWRRMMQGLTPAERMEIHEKMDRVAPEDRAGFKHELLEVWRARHVGG